MNNKSLIFLILGIIFAFVIPLFVFGYTDCDYCYNAQVGSFSLGIIFMIAYIVLFVKNKKKKR